MRKTLKIFYFFLLVFIFLFLIKKEILAKDYRVEYEVSYFLEEKKDKIASPVSFKIKITNLTSKVFVERFTLTFPSSFGIREIKAKDDWGEIAPFIETVNDVIKITLKFSNPNIGKDSINNFYLNFYQDNLFKINGNVWEVILPTIERIEDDSYKVIVHLPQDTDKKISLAKPSPTLVSENKIIWENPREKTIYAIFGEKQYYETTLYYHLKNEKPYPVYTEVAFPPDTLYQKVFIKKIDPKPFFVYQDSDGNFLGRYFLKPLEKKMIIFDGVIAIYAKPRVEVRDFINKKIKSQRNYLLTSHSPWQIKGIEDNKEIASLKNPNDIYRYVVEKLEYNQALVFKKNERKGADFALKYPNQAVCTEFTDLFIALAREKGIFAREIEGFGFTQDEKLRPLTLTSDILHAWPEYYDEGKKLWIPIDPTWEDTSGIDYFSSFDLNHIVFVIHGKNPFYPVSAGMYKIENSSDIVIKPKKEEIKDNVKVIVKLINFPKKIDDKNFYSINLLVENQSNVYLWDKKINFEAQGIDVKPKEFLIESLLPFEKKELKIKIKSLFKNKKTSAFFKVFFDEKKIEENSVLIVPFYYNLSLKIAIFVLFFGGLFLIFFRR